MGSGSRLGYRGAVQGHGRRQFRIGPCLGRGGYGCVYRATMRSPGGLETTVALKVLRESVIITDDAMVRLRDEGRLLGRINHPVVVRAFDFTTVDGRIALVTEFVDGDDLERCLVEPERMGLRALLTVIGRLASALDAAWNATDPAGQPLRIVHRDIKPSNVRIGRHGEVKLLDFGIARFQALDGETRPVSDIVLGSVPYLSPERLVERASLPEGDIFGLGCLLYEGIAGSRFHKDGTLRSVSTVCSDPERYERYLRERLAQAEAACLEPLPATVLALVRRCLSFEPAQRPRASELVAWCESIADELPGMTLKRWCAARTWGSELDGGEGTALTHAGDLTGRIHGEEAPPQVEPAEPWPKARPGLVGTTLGLVAFGCLGLGTGLLLTVLALASVGFFVGWP